jgi:hypothetical protein
MTAMFVTLMVAPLLATLVVVFLLTSLLELAAVLMTVMLVPLMSCWPRC